MRSLDACALSKLSLRHALLFAEMGNALADSLSYFVHLTTS
jgi:hypothetical protein